MTIWRLRESTARLVHCTPSVDSLLTHGTVLGLIWVLYAVFYEALRDPGLCQSFPWCHALGSWGYRVGSKLLCFIKRSTCRAYSGDQGVAVWVAGSRSAGWGFVVLHDIAAQIAAVAGVFAVVRFHLPEHGSVHDNMRLGSQVLVCVSAHVMATELSRLVWTRITLAPDIPRSWAVGGYWCADIGSNECRSGVS